VHLFKTGHSVFGPRGAVTAGTWYQQPEVVDSYTLNLFACGPEDSFLVINYLHDLLHDGKLELPERESYQRYRHDQLEPVEAWFRHPRYSTVS
jgi:hypothetical protein